MHASEACDVWSVGVVAYELLTGERVLGTAMTKAEMLDALSGRTALPWEGAHAEAALKKLLRFDARCFNACRATRVDVQALRNWLQPSTVSSAP
jgi:serine/threonine protein kinase